ncbi:metal-dependent hydrolase [Lacisediminimonas sp.]|uniref:metal-dependent hydrolase n=1 Tax=Lacisediminimonas sp. TaxID=3060582 RepID=UPI002725DA00|nr:metal-dependent hydrolase [Lacisediminimonas sp.]MDO8299932.1 metal-dependent hydrolase [Lacisediminimonas sp.]
MFIGHFGLAFGAKATAPKVSLGSLFLAAQFIDLLWPTLLLLGIERVEINTRISQGPPLDFVHYPISHSLLMVLVWAALVGVVHYRFRHNLRGALVLAAAVISHWILDSIVHYPDLPLYPGSAQLAGLGIWSSPVASMAIELGIFAVGLYLYLRSTKSIDHTGKWALWALVGFLVLVHVANAFGPPPPGTAALVWVGQAQWLLVAWAYWVDRHRRPASGAGSGADLAWQTEGQ